MQGIENPEKQSQPELVENTTLNQVTLVLQMIKEVVVEETDNLAQNNERSLSEVLVKKNFDKILPIIKDLEKKEVLHLKKQRKYVVNLRQR